MTRKLTYIAVPYTHADPQVRQIRHDIVTRYTAGLMQRGVIAFSPISHTHAMAVRHGLPETWAFWQASCHAFLSASERVIVLMLDGWRESIGVQAEIRIAESMGLELAYDSPSEERVTT